MKKLLPLLVSIILLSLVVNASDYKDTYVQLLLEEN